MRVCLDTNAYSRLAQGDGPLTAFLETVDEILIPGTVVGELTFGFLRGTRCAKNEEALRRFFQQEVVSFQPITYGIAERYGYVKASLKRNGTPIPENDIWIAAAALETGCRIVSYDGHFDRVGGLMRIAP